MKIAAYPPSVAKALASDPEICAAGSQVAMAVKGWYGNGSGIIGLATHAAGRVPVRSRCPQHEKDVTHLFVACEVLHACLHACRSPAW